MDKKNKTRRISRSRYLLSALVAIVLSVATALCCLPTMKANALNRSDYQLSGLSLPLYDYSTGQFDEEALDKLAAMILDADPDNPNQRKLADLINKAAENSFSPGQPNYDGTAIVNIPGGGARTMFAFGQYTDKSNLKQALVWEPMYLSQARYSNEGTQQGDSILTVWLCQSPNANQGMSTWCDPTNLTAVPTQAADRGLNPSIYATSYLRSFALGQKGGYVSYSLDSKNKATGYWTMQGLSNASNPDGYPAVKDNNPYSEFTKTYDSYTNTISTGLFYGMSGVITRPASMEWQKSQLANDVISSSSYTVAKTGKENAAKTAESDFRYGTGAIPNEAWDDVDLPYIISDVNYAKGYAATEKDYHRWKDDTLWLPSVSETGTGGLVNSKAGANEYVLNGYWRTNGISRANGAGSSAKSSFLRSDAYVGYMSANGYVKEANVKKAAYYGTVIEADKTSTTSGTVYGKIKVSKSLSKGSTAEGVRPALHINLSAIARLINTVDTTPVYAEYNGEMQDFKTVVTANVGVNEFGDTVNSDGTDVKYNWYDAMFNPSATIDYCYGDDIGPYQASALPAGETPTDVGIYYAHVTLSDSFSWTGQPANVKDYYVKFVILPKRVYAYWKCDNVNMPTGVGLMEDPPPPTSQNEFTPYERDQEEPSSMIEIDWYFLDASGQPCLDAHDNYSKPKVKGYYTAKAYLKKGGKEVKDGMVCNYVLGDDGAVMGYTFMYTPTVKKPTFTNGEVKRTELYKSPQDQAGNDDAGTETGEALLYQIANYDSEFIDFSRISVYYSSAVGLTGTPVDSKVARVLMPVNANGGPTDYIYLGFFSDSSNIVNPIVFNAGVYTIKFPMNSEAKVGQYNWSDGTTYNDDATLTLTIQPTEFKLLLNKGQSGTSATSGKQYVSQSNSNAETPLELEIIGAGTDDAKNLLKSAALSLSYGQSNQLGNNEVSFRWDGAEGRWYIKALNLEKGKRYTLNVKFDTNASANYKPSNASGNYNFYVYVASVASELRLDEIKWQATNSSTGEIIALEGGDEDEVQTVPFIDIPYVFTLGLTEKELNEHGVYIEYKGNRQSQCGTYTIVATVNAVNPTLSPDFEQQIISVEVGITQSVYDLSQTAWTEDTIRTIGNAALTSLPAGLTAEYSFVVKDENKEKVKCEVTAKFLVNNGNYVCPVEGKPETYEYLAGQPFPFSYTYTYDRTVIELIYQQGIEVNGTYMLPTFIAGDSTIVEQTYYDANTHKAVTNFEKGQTCYLGVKVCDPAKYVLFYKDNYRTSLAEETFMIPANMSSTSTFVVLANDVPMYGGQRFDFSGTAINFAVSSSSSLAISYSCKVYVNSDATKKLLDKPPTAVGEYTLVATVEKIGNSVVNMTLPEIKYSIVPAVVKLADVNIVFKDQSGNEVYKVRYLETQGGWYNRDGKLFDFFNIPYIPGGYKIEADTSKVAGLSIKFAGDTEPVNADVYRLKVDRVDFSSNYVSGIDSVFGTGDPNNPKFINYQIVKANLDLSTIAWTVEANGIPSRGDVDFSKPLTYGPGYQYKVKIANLPSELEGQIAYVTYDANDNGSPRAQMSASGVSQQGSYNTYFSFNGSKEFASSNYNKITVQDLSLFLNNSEYLTWSIAYKGTTVLDTKTLVFDGKDHDIYELFQLSEIEKITLTKVKIVYNDSQGAQIDDYPGYTNDKGVVQTGKIFHAGTYQVQFSDADDTVRTNWGQIKIDPLQISGKWEYAAPRGNSRYDIFFLDPSYSQYNDLIQMLYTDKYGKVSEGMPKASGQYTAKVVIKDDNKGDIILRINNNGGLDTTDMFDYTAWMPTSTSTRLPYPVFDQMANAVMIGEVLTVTFDGTTKEFTIKDWANKYAPYLNINGTLSAVAVGKYTINFTFKPTVDACWQASNDQSPHPLTYEIVKKNLDNLTAVAVPYFAVETMPYTGDDIEFALKDSSDYVVILEDSSDSLTQKLPGKYWIKVALRDKVNTYWADTEGEVGDKTLVFYITGSPQINPNPDDNKRPDTIVDLIDPDKKLINPQYLFIDPRVKQYTGEDITFTIDNWQFLMSQLTIKKGSLVQKKAGRYSVSVGFTPTALADGWTWSDGSYGNVELSFWILYEKEYMQWVSDNSYDPWEAGDYTEDFPPVPGSGADLNKIIMYVLIGFGILLLILAIILIVMIASSSREEEDYYDDFSMVYNLNDDIYEEEEDDDYDEEDDYDYDYDYGPNGEIVY